MIDGYLARRMNAATKFGAALDSVADFVFVAVILCKLITIIKLSGWMLIWLLIILIIKFATLLTGFMKYQSLAFLHTYMNKITGGLLFCFPVFYAVFGILPTAFLLLGAATLAAAEELLINLTSKILNPDVKLFLKVKNNKDYK